MSGSKLKQAQAIAPVERASLAPLPRQFHLYPNFPNPFNPETQIQFDLPEAEHVQLQIYNAVGQWVRTHGQTEMEAKNAFLAFSNSSAGPRLSKKSNYRIPSEGEGCFDSAQHPGAWQYLTFEQLRGFVGFRW